MTAAPYYSAADICFDLVTGSSYVKYKAGLYTNAVQDLLAFVKAKVSDNTLAPLNDYELFGELLARCNESTDLVNYFIKPITLVTSTEAFAFRSSDYAKFIHDRLDPSMEAMEEDTEDTEAEEETETGTGTDPESQDDSTSTDEPDMSETTSDDTSMDQSDKSVTAEPDKKPQIDPDQMLLELAKPNELMSDYIFREIVARRISNIIKNPPENALPNDLLMLKRWRSRWLYLASISCLRDFLTRVSIRLSNG